MPNPKISKIKLKLSNSETVYDIQDKTSGYITLSDVPKELFYCTYGTTTYAEITSALSTGKLPACFYNNRTYLLASHTASTYRFSSAQNDYIRYVTVDDSDVWATAAYNFELANNKTQSITSSSTSSQYSSAKAVYDYAQPIIDSSHKLNADLVDDTDTTNKFVTISEKTTWNSCVKTVVLNIEDDGSGEFFGEDLPSELLEQIYEENVCIKLNLTEDNNIVRTLFLFKIYSDPEAEEVKYGYCSAWWDSVEELYLIFWSDGSYFGEYLEYTPDRIQATTNVPNRANDEAYKFAVLDSEPQNYYDGYIYYIKPHSLTVTVNVTNGTYSGVNSIISGNSTKNLGTIIPSAGYRLPKEINFDGAIVKYNNVSGALSAAVRTDNIVINTICEPILYNLYSTINNGSTSIAIPSTIQQGTTISFTISAGLGYILPESIGVVGASYTYDNQTGAVTISNPIADTYLVINCPLEHGGFSFSSENAFTLSYYYGVKTWDGTIEYSLDEADSWSTWDGTTPITAALDSKSKYLILLRGTGNTIITGQAEVGLDNFDRRLVITGNNVICSGNIECLLDYQAVDSNDHPTVGMAAFKTLFYGCAALTSAPTLGSTDLNVYCYQYMFTGCSNLISPPRLPATILKRNCYDSMFRDCTSLTSLPAIRTTNFPDRACLRMFYGCTNIHISESETSTYKNRYSFPYEGAASLSGNFSLGSVFQNTGGPYQGPNNSGDVSVNTNYYTSNEIII